MKYYIISILIPFFILGCAGIDTTKRLETVVDREYIPKECPQFTHNLVIDGKKYSTNYDISVTSVVTDLDSFIESLERNKLARQTFNSGVKESNKALVILGEPETSHFKRVKKRILVDRICPKFIYKPNIKAKKLTDNFTPESNTTYVVITLDEMVTELQRNKFARETYNNQIDTINKKSFVKGLKARFDNTVTISVEKIDETTNKIKKLATDTVKDKVKETTKETIFGD